MRNNFRERMSVTVSHAEHILFVAFSKAGITQGMTTGKSVTLEPPSEMHPKGIVTIPDFSWFSLFHAVFLDGLAVHRGKRVEKDDEVTRMLSEQGWTVQRFSYNPPLSHRQTVLVVESVSREVHRKQREVAENAEKNGE